MCNFIFTSESIIEGHPDRIFDAFADRILDEALRQDSKSKMAVEATIKDELIFIYGETNTTANLNYEEITLQALQDIGYNENYKVMIKVGKQPSEINQAVEKDTELAQVTKD